MGQSIFPDGKRIQELKYDNDTQTAFWNLPEDEEVVLFTPYVPQPRGWKPPANGLDKDPFENLGRAIAQLHPGRLVHVPYVPLVGFSDIHSGHVDEATTIVVVIAEPYREVGERYQLFMDKQQEFAKIAMDTYHEIHAGTEPDALIIVYCGKDKYTPPNTVGTAIQVEDYTGEDWTAVAKYLINGEMS